MKIKKTWIKLGLCLAAFVLLLPLMILITLNLAAPGAATILAILCLYAGSTIISYTQKEGGHFGRNTKKRY